MVKDRYNEVVPHYWAKTQKVLADYYLANCCSVAISIDTHITNFELFTGIRGFRAENMVRAKLSKSYYLKPLEDFCDEELLIGAWL